MSEASTRKCWIYLLRHASKAAGKILGALETESLDPFCVCANTQNGKRQSIQPRHATHAIVINSIKHSGQRVRPVDRRSLITTVLLSEGISVLLRFTIADVNRCSVQCVSIALHSTQEHGNSAAGAQCRGMAFQHQRYGNLYGGSCSVTLGKRPR